MNEPTIVAGIDISRKYHYTDILDMYHKGLLKPIALEGYLVQTDVLTGMIGFVPWHESHLARSEADKPVSVAFDADEMRADVEAEHPIRRRTPQERQAAVALRVMAEAKRTGSTGLSDAQMSEIVGESWRNGQPVTGTDIQAVAAHFLAKGERQNKDADAHRSTKAHMTA